MVLHDPGMSHNDDTSPAAMIPTAALLSDDHDFALQRPHQHQTTALGALAYPMKVSPPSLQGPITRRWTYHALNHELAH